MGDLTIEDIVIESLYISKDVPFIAIHERGDPSFTNKRLREKFILNFIFTMLIIFPCVMGNRRTGALVILLLLYYRGMHGLAHL